DLDRVTQFLSGRQRIDRREGDLLAGDSRLHRSVGIHEAHLRRYRCFYLDLVAGQRALGHKINTIFLTATDGHGVALVSDSETERRQAENLDGRFALRSQARVGGDYRDME